jgi:hypothetical protein
MLVSLSLVMFCLLVSSFHPSAVARLHFAKLSGPRTQRTFLKPPELCSARTHDPTSFHAGKTFEELPPSFIMQKLYRKALHPRNGARRTETAISLYLA